MPATSAVNIQFLNIKYFSACTTNEIEIIGYKSSGRFHQAETQYFTIQMYRQLSYALIFLIFLIWRRTSRQSIRIKPTCRRPGKLWEVIHKKKGTTASDITIGEDGLHL
jgi:hypothetical protein